MELAKLSQTPNQVKLQESKRLAEKLKNYNSKKIEEF